MKRALLGSAIVLVLIIAAFGLRALREPSVPPPEVAVARVLICASELTEACFALVSETVEVRIEAPGETLRRLKSGESLGGDAWLAPRPWIELAELDARDAGRVAVFDDVSPTLARSPLVMIIRSDRRGVLEAACNGTIHWLCLASRAGVPWDQLGGPAGWGTLQVGIDDPAQSTAGLLSLVQMAATYARRDRFDARDLETVTATMVGVIRAAAEPMAPDALEVIMQRRESLDIVSALTARTPIAIASPRASGQLELIEVIPTVRADVVLAVRTGGTPPVEQSAARDALTAQGWHFDDDSFSGVPDPGTLRALMALWAQARPPR